MGEEAHSPQEQVRRLYKGAEKRTAEAMERVVGTNSFGEVLARLTENTLAITRIGNDALDLALRNLRLAGRQDITRLARQLARTEDKLERVLQEVEALHERLDADRADSSNRGTRSQRPRASARANSSGRGGKASGRSGNSSPRGGRSAGGGGSSSSDA
jgi:uncharacterized membrane protein YgcG